MQKGWAWRRFGFQSPSCGKNVELELAVETDKVDSRDLHTIIIVCHGRERNAEEILLQARRLFRDGKTLIIAPHFLNGLDKDHIQKQEQNQGSSNRLLIWKANEWGEGGSSKSPSDSPISSFECLDQLLYLHSDTNQFPRVQRIILVGHSLGGQLVQRYSVLGWGLEHGKKVDLTYVVMNPSTYLYLNERIPYKYGLAERQISLRDYRPALTIDVRTIIARLHQRRIVYLQGEQDHGVGDDRPQAMSQGKNRIERCQNWQHHLSAVGWPSSHSFAYVPGAGHDAGNMMASKQFLQILQKL